jgi:hypothetical protein
MLRDMDQMDQMYSGKKAPNPESGTPSAADSEAILKQLSQ